MNDGEKKMRASASNLTGRGAPAVRDVNRRAWPRRREDKREGKTE